MSLYHPYKKGTGGHPHHGQSLIGNKNQSQSSKKKNDTQAHNAGGHSEYNLVAPIRQTASIFKQPVTVYKEHKSKVKAELKHVSREKPLQLFWTKRLSSINTVNMTEPDVGRRRITLPPSLKATGPGITDHQLLASISTHLHITKDPASGQGATEANIEKNPTAFINPGQPLMCRVSVSDEEILEQEAKVKEARQKLAQAIKALG